VETEGEAARRGVQSLSLLLGLPLLLSLFLLHLQLLFLPPAAVPQVQVESRKHSNQKQQKRFFEDMRDKVKVHFGLRKEKKKKKIRCLGTHSNAPGNMGDIMAQLDFKKFFVKKIDFFYLGKCDIPFSKSQCDFSF